MGETFWARPAEPDARHTPDISFLLEHTTKRINECNNEAIHDVACQTWRVLKTPGGFIHSRLDNNNRRCRCRSFTGKYYTKHATFLAHESRDQFSTRRAREGIVGYTRLLLSRCEPDMANLANYTYSKFLAGSIYENFNVVSAKICQQSDKSKLDDGFRSFPSGHASFSSGGLIYLSLFLAPKLAITIPFLASGSSATQLSAFPSRASTARTMENRSMESRDKPMAERDSLQEPSGHDDAVIAARNQAAGPPVYLLVIAVLPSFASIYIASTRYSDFRHHGFDILFGYLIGFVTSVFAFRYYHLPINQGAGWSWGPRSRDRSFWAGVGVGNYVGSREKHPEQILQRNDTDLEAGRAVHQRNQTNEDRIELLPMRERSDGSRRP